MRARLLRSGGTEACGYAWASTALSPVCGLRLAPRNGASGRFRSSAILLSLVCCKHLLPGSLRQNGPSEFRERSWKRFPVGAQLRRVRRGSSGAYGPLDPFQRPRCTGRLEPAGHDHRVPPHGGGGETSVTMTYSTNTSTYAVVVAVYSGVNPNQPLMCMPRGRQRPARCHRPLGDHDSRQRPAAGVPGCVRDVLREDLDSANGTAEAAQVNSTANDSTGSPPRHWGQRSHRNRDLDVRRQRQPTTVSVALSQAPPQASGITLVGHRQRRAASKPA